MMSLEDPGIPASPRGMFPRIGTPVLLSILGTACLAVLASYVLANSELTWVWARGSLQNSPPQLFDGRAWGRTLPVFELHASDDPGDPKTRWPWGAAADLTPGAKQFEHEVTFLVTQPEPAGLDLNTGQPMPGADGVTLIVKAIRPAGTDVLCEVPLDAHIRPDQRRWQDVRVRAPADTTGLLLEAASRGSNWFDKVWVHTAECKVVWRGLAVSGMARWVGVLAAIVGLSTAAVLVVRLIRSLTPYELLAAAGLGFVLYLVNAPGIWGYYLYYDDYCLADWTCPDFGILEAVSKAGRFAAFFYWQALSLVVKDISLAPYARLLGLGSIFLLAGVTYRWLRVCRLGALQAAMIAFLIATLPSSLLYVSWIICVPFSLAAVLAGYAAMLICRPEHSLLLRGWGTPLAAGTLFVLGLCIYQPSAMYYWVILLAFALTRRYDEPREPWFRPFCSSAVLGTAAIGVYFLLFKGILHFAGISPQARAGLSLDPVQKLQWFWGNVLPPAMSLWHISGGEGTMWACLLVIAAGCLAGAATLWGRSRQGRAVAQRLAICFLIAPALCLLAQLPSLATSDGWVSYRAMFALMCAVVLLVYAGLEGLASLLPDRLGQLCVTATLAVLCTYAAAAGNRNIARSFAVPHERELTYVKEVLSGPGGREARKIGVIGPSPVRTSPVARFDEFGQCSTAAGWCSPSLVRSALRELGYTVHGRSISDATTTATTKPADDLFIVDMRRFRVAN